MAATSKTETAATLAFASKESSEHKPIDMHAGPLRSAVVLQQLAGRDECLQTKPTPAFQFHYLFHFKCQSGAGVLAGGRSRYQGTWEDL